MSSSSCTPRLAVVAAIINEGDDGDGGYIDRPLARSARLGSDLRSDQESDAATDATQQERELALALCGERDAATTADHAIAELLLLADYERAAADLAAGLSRTFLRPHGSGDPLAPIAAQKRRSAFVDLYRRLSLHQLNSQVRNKAAATLYKLTSR